jgi:hypothetical protein
MKTASLIIMILGILCMTVKTEKLIPMPQIVGVILIMTACFTDRTIKKSVRRN